MRKGCLEMETIVEVKNLRKAFKKRRSKEVIQAVENVSFTVKRGEILGLLGTNGAGKTTTIKMICGLLTPDSGTVIVNGLDNQAKRLETLCEISAVLEGNRNIYWRLTVRENLEYFAGNRGVSRKEVAGRIEELLKQFSLKDKENELVNRLSRGMQQKLAIAVALLADSEVILLDEPTLGLDVETGYEIRELLKDIVKNQKRTIIMSSHDMGVIQDLCERTVIINNGQLVTDDRVENLLRLFEVRSYTVTLGEPLNDEQTQGLTKKFPVHTYEQDDGGRPTIEVELARSEEIYDLFALLKWNETQIEAIDRSTINFEQVFMEIVKEDNGYEVAPSVSS